MRLCDVPLSKQVYSISRVLTCVTVLTKHVNMHRMNMALPKIEVRCEISPLSYAHLPPLSGSGNMRQLKKKIYLLLCNFSFYVVIKLTFKVQRETG